MRTQRDAGGSLADPGEHRGDAAPPSHLWSAREVVSEFLGAPWLRCTSGATRAGDQTPTASAGTCGTTPRLSGVGWTTTVPARCPDVAGNVQKRPDGKWRARYRDPAGRERTKHFTRKRDAERVKSAGSPVCPHPWHAVSGSTRPWPG